MAERTPPFDYARASELMEAAGADVLLACSRANVGYLADYTYYVAQGLPYVLEDGREWSVTFVGVPRDPAKGAFMTPVSSEESRTPIRGSPTGVSGDHPGGTPAARARPRRGPRATSRCASPTRCASAGSTRDGSRSSSLRSPRRGTYGCGSSCRAPNSSTRRRSSRRSAS